MEYAERKLGYRVPIRRLRWKDDREMALRGDDIVGLEETPGSGLRFLKGESKSRVVVTPGVVSEAGQTLDENRGNPSAHSVLFIAQRLREAGEDGLAAKLEDAVLNSYGGCGIEHLLFSLSGNDPEAHLSAHLDGLRSRRRRHAVGLTITDHARFIEELYAVGQDD